VPCLLLLQPWSRGRGAFGPLLQFRHCQGARLHTLQTTNLRTSSWNATNHLGGRDAEGEIDGNRPRSQSPENCSHLGTRQMYPQAPIALKYIINSPRIEDQKQYMRDFALIGKILGLWPSEKDLVKCIQHWWKPKGHYDLQLGSKGFFNIILHNLEDINRIFEGGSYFYNSAGLFLYFWMERFNPKKEDFTHAPIWLRLYFLPREFWLEEILAGIDNTIGIYVKALEATRQRRYTAYARICVYLNISKPIPGAITLDYQDDKWSQTLD
jgi:hypothetical protein